MPQGSVAKSMVSRMSVMMSSRSDKIWDRVLVPNTFLSVDAASRLVLDEKFSTLVTAKIGF